MTKFHNDVLPLAPSVSMPLRVVSTCCRGLARGVLGRGDNACALTAAALRGHSRVEFENKTLRADGSLSADYSALVGHDRQSIAMFGRSDADSHHIREYFEVAAG